MNVAARFLATARRDGAEAGFDPGALSPGTAFPPGSPKRLAQFRRREEGERVPVLPPLMGRTGRGANDVVLASRILGAKSCQPAQLESVGVPFTFDGVHGIAPARTEWRRLRPSCSRAAGVGSLAFGAGLPNTGAVEPTLTELTDRLVASYAQVGGINHLDGKNLPSKQAIAGITQELLRLLFPGFFEEKPLHSSEIKVVTAARLDAIVGPLEDEIRKALEYNPPPELRRGRLAAAAHSLTLEFLASLPRLREVLQTDVEAAYNGDPAALSREEVIVAYPFVEAIAVQRLAHELYLKNIPLIPRIMTEWAHSRTGMDLHPGAQIGAYFFVDHCTGTVVGETAIIGDHVKMYQGVGLVARSLAAGQALRGQKRHPTIEDRVTIYAGATIMGGDTVVGEGSTIGANVFLTRSVPANSLVVYENANIRVLSKNDRQVRTGEFQI